MRENYNMHDGIIETCEALFYDSGGSNNNYGNSQDYTLTFKPVSEGNRICVNFLEFETEADYDFLYIYDGSSADAPLIGQYDGNQSPGLVTASNNQGTLTFRFTSDRGVNASGWTATVSCIDATSIDEVGCQNIARVYPNPSRGCINIEANDEMDYHLYNNLGQSVRNGRFNHATQINTEELPQGIYFLQLKGEHGMQTEKILIEK